VSLHLYQALSRAYRLVCNRVGHGSGPPTGPAGWIGSGRVGVTKFSVVGGSGWVGSSVKNV